MNKLTTEEKLKRIVARGEHSGHSHIVTVINGDVQVEKKDDKVIVIVGEDSNASLRHLLEKPYMEEDKEVWTGEHKDIPLPCGKYEFVIQQEHDAYKNAPRNVVD